MRTPVVKRKLVIAGALIAISSLMLIGCSSESKSPSTLYVGTVEGTQTENIEAIAKGFNSLAEARLLKNRSSIDSIAKELLADDSYTRFMQAFDDYIARQENGNEYIDVEKLYQSAKSSWDSTLEEAREYGLLDENNNLTPLAEQIIAENRGETREITVQSETTVAPDESSTVSTEAANETAETTAATEEAESTPTEPESTPIETETTAETAETNQTESAAVTQESELASIETDTEQQAENSVETQESQDSAIQIDNSINPFGSTDYPEITARVNSISYPATVDGLIQFLEENVWYLGDGEEIIAMNDSRTQQWIYLGITSFSSPYLVEPATAGDIESMSYEQVLERTRQIYWVFCVDEAYLNNSITSSDTRTEEEKQQEYQEQMERYEARQEELRQQEEEKAQSSIGDADDIPLGLIAALNSDTLLNPKIDDIIKTDENGNHVIYWDDIETNLTTLNVTMFDEVIIINLADYSWPMSKYSEQSYEDFNWTLEEAPLDEKYPYRIAQYLTSDDAVHYELNIEYKLTPEYKIELTDEQIEAIFSTYGTAEQTQ